jgi:lipopolysaccharide export system permease protein
MLAVIMSIAVIFDVSEKLEDFLSNKAPISAIILDYYVNFVIHYSNLFSSLLIFISVIFFTSKLASNTEIVAILSSGVSFNRLLVPYFIAATILASLSLYFNHWQVPLANKKRLDFEETYVRNPYNFSERNIHRQISPGEFIFIESFSTRKSTGYKFAWELWDHSTLKFKLVSDFIRYDTTKKSWVINNYQIRKIEGNKETIRTGLALDTTIRLNPDDFLKRMEYIEAMNYYEIDAYIEEQTMLGNEELPFFLIEKHQRTSYPFATYILTLIAVSVSSRKVRGGIGLHIAFGMVICVTYILAMKVTTVYATNAGLDPLIAVWIPNFLFTILAIFIYRKAPK